MKRQIPLNRFAWGRMARIIATISVILIPFVLAFSDTRQQHKNDFFTPRTYNRSFHIAHSGDISLRNQQVSLSHFAVDSNTQIQTEYKQDVSKKLHQTLFYARAEDAGLNPFKLLKIDSIIMEAIEKGAMPGGQVFVSKNGIIVYEKAFGYHDYTLTKPVLPDDLYDVSSLTKIAATTLAAMKLTQDSILNLSAPLGNYFRDTTIRYTHVRKDTVVIQKTLQIAGMDEEEIKRRVRGRKITYRSDSAILMNETIRRPHMPESNIFRVPVYRLLAHHSGINPSLPLTPYTAYLDTYQKILKNKQSGNILAAHIREDYEEPGENQDEILMKDTREIDFVNETVFPFRFTREEAFNHFYSRNLTDKSVTPVTDSMFLRNQFMDSLYQAVKRIRVFPMDGYRYACINMILLQMAIDSITQSNLDDFMKQEFYQPLGMHNTTYNPLRFFPRERIAPTENENVWRMQLIHGTVHDPSAALLGGIAGNAGLFSTASDLGILGQMLLNGGEYGEQRYLSSEIIELFTSRQSLNHRGLGFNKPTPGGNHARDIPESAFGHVGFTGTAMWIDPENEIVFVFLSNRIHPSASNNLLQKMKVRERVHQAVYDAIRK
jgi:CubicO group peptidase (beta-lactamase class C family)